jgi:hypothetical protein
MRTQAAVTCGSLRSNFSEAVIQISLSKHFARHDQVLYLTNNYCAISSSTSIYFTKQGIPRPYHNPKSTIESLTFKSNCGELTTIRCKSVVLELQVMMLTMSRRWVKISFQISLLNLYTCGP